MLPFSETCFFFRNSCYSLLKLYFFFFLNISHLLDTDCTVILLMLYIIPSKSLNGDKITWLGCVNPLSFSWAMQSSWLEYQDCWTDARCSDGGWLEGGRYWPGIAKVTSACWAVSWCVECPVYTGLEIYLRRRRCNDSPSCIVVSRRTDAVSISSDELTTDRKCGVGDARIAAGRDSGVSGSCIPYSVYFILFYICSFFF